jgi:hypothetical protein
MKVSKMLHTKVEARTEGSILVAAFHAATPPLVWRYDLARNHSFTLGIRESVNGWELGLSTLPAEFQPVAHFITYEDATQAIAQVEKALMKRGGHMGWFWPLMKILGGLILALVLGVILYLGFSLFNVTRVAGNMAASAVSSAAGGMPAVPAAPKEPMRSGVPLSADDVLTMPGR